MFCPNCGTENEDAATTCKKCGFNLRGAAAPKFKGTMLMVNPPGQAPRSPGPAIGVPGQAMAPPIPSGGAPRPNLKGTMLGVAPPGFGAPHPAAGPPPPHPGPPAPGGVAPVPRSMDGDLGVNPLGGTLVADPTAMRPGPSEHQGGFGPAAGGFGPAASGPPGGFGPPPGGFGPPPGGTHSGGFERPPGAPGGFGPSPLAGAPGGFGPPAVAPPGGGGVAPVQPGAFLPSPDAVQPAFGQPMGDYGAPAPARGGYVQPVASGPIPGAGPLVRSGPTGAVGKERNPVIVLVLSSLCFVYALIQVWEMLNELKEFRQKEDLIPILFFIPILGHIELWKLPQKVLDAKQMAGIPNPTVPHPVLYLLLGVYFLPADLNEIWKAAGGGVK